MRRDFTFQSWEKNKAQGSCDSKSLENRRGKLDLNSHANECIEFYPYFPPVSSPARHFFRVAEGNLFSGLRYAKKTRRKRS